MKRQKISILAAAVACASFTPLAMSADTITEALQASKAFGDFRLRYEDVESGTTSSDGLTLRSRFGFKTGSYAGFSALVEAEDVRDVGGIDDENGLIPDPEVTEIDQAFLQYAAGDFTAKLGRQVITLDGHRFIGHVGFRQDRQTFDAVRLKGKLSDSVNLDLSYIYQRNRIFAETLDAKSDDVLLNASFKTGIGKVTTYSYLLDDSNRDEQSDTYGISLNGAAGDKTKFLYSLEYATQDITDSGTEFEADYVKFEPGVKINGITLKAGYEVLGSDNGNASFTTPLATLHKFNGWNDIFLGGTFNPTAMPNGLEDVYVSAATKVKGVLLKVVHHEFTSDEGSTDYGDETGLLIAKKFKSHNMGLKHATYSADNFGVDTDKLWVWVGTKF